MTSHVVLFHSALGRRGVEQAFAQALRRDGHEVTVPDLYGGRTASTLAEGLELKDVVGWAAICARARRAVEDLPADTVLAGISMGTGVVSELWPDRPQTRAVLLLHGWAAVPTGPMAGSARAALHAAVDDPFAPSDVLDEWQASAAARGIGAEVQRYAGVGHFFTDPQSPDFDGPSAALLLQRCREFLRDVRT